MTEPNVNGKQTNRTLYEALIALIEMGKEEKLPADGIGFRLALNKNALRPIGEAIEEAQKALRAEVGITGHELPRTPEERAAYAIKAELFTQRLRDLMAQEVEWSSPAKVRWQQFADRQLKSEWLAPLLEAGIVTCDPAELDAPAPDKK